MSALVFLLHLGTNSTQICSCFMKNLQLLPSTLRDESIVKVSFSYDQELIQTLKSMDGSQWSLTLKSWYFKQHSFKLNTFFNKFKGIAYVDYSQLQQKSPPSTPKKIILKTHKPPIELPPAYLEQLTLKRYSSNTIKIYVSEFKKFRSFYATKNIDTVTQDDIKRYLLFLIQKQKVSISLQNQAINAIKFYYEKVLRQPKMVFTIERPRKEKLLPKVLSKQEVFAIIASIQNLKHRCIISLIYSAGLRRSELLNLQIHDLDSSRNLIIIRGGKGNKDRHSIISKNLFENLREYYRAFKPKKWLFEGAIGGQYSPSSISKILSKASKNAGIPRKTTPHMLRHSFATHLLEQGVSLRHIQMLLGHSSSKTTEIYTQVSTQEIGRIKNPLDDFYKTKSSTIHANLGCIVEQNTEYNGNMHT